MAASSTFVHPEVTPVTQNGLFFSCNVDDQTFTTVANDSSLTSVFTYADNKRSTPAALFISAEQHNGSRTSSIYLQPVNDDAPAKKLVVYDNLYKEFYITYKAPDNSFYNTTTAPGNLEITSIDSIHKVVTGKLNCVLYSSTKQDWLLITNGRFRLKY